MSKTTSCPCIKLFCTFLCSPYTTTTWNDQILSLLGNGKRNCKAINSSISVRTWVRSLLFSSKLNSLLLSNWAPRNNREKLWMDVKSIFQWRFHGRRRCRNVRSLMLAYENSDLSSLLAARDVSPGGTSAPLQFHTVLLKSRWWSTRN